ncbi:MAG: hypothetical protein H6604_04405 [Flavobacteriales bacterium]|nr:hypothetical protein [Flavobacteriales bacterium]
MDISEYKRNKNKKEYKRHPWETARLSFLVDFIQNQLQNTKIENIIDVGCGDCFVIDSLAKKNITQNYYAIDIAFTPEIVSKLKQKNSDKINYFRHISELLDSTINLDNSLILCMDVLEHIEDESVLLNELIKLKGNHFLFTVPAFQTLFSSHDTLLGHYRRYTENEFVNLLTNQGFKKQKSGYFFVSLYFARWIEKLLKKDKKESIDNWEGSHLKTHLIETVLKLDYKFCLLLNKVGIKIPGLSVFCLCKN